MDIFGVLFKGMEVCSQSLAILLKEEGGTPKTCKYRNLGTFTPLYHTRSIVQTPQHCLSNLTSVHIAFHGTISSQDCIGTKIFSVEDFLAGEKQNYLLLM